MAKTSWRDSWEVVESLPAGGHGYTFRVRRRNDSAAIYVLKKLKDQKNPERRARLFAEACALQVLDHARIARYVDSNCESHSDPSVDLYLVTEFVDGKPMSQIDGPVSISDAVASLDGILEALAFCHQRGSLHRDLKPDNVILRNGNVCDPVVIDFGQTFNTTEISPGFRTDSGQHLGNRFMLLPELLTTGADKRNQLSDISFCVGLLFFLLTNQPPEALRDHTHKQPHERAAARQVLAAVSPTQLHQLNRIFQIGFVEEFDGRWQSISELRNEIQKLVDPLLGKSPPPLAHRLKLIRQNVLNNPEHAVRSRLADLSAHFCKIVNESAATIQRVLEGVITVNVGQFSQDAKGGTQGFLVYFFHPQFASQVIVEIGLARTGGQIRVIGGTRPPSDQIFAEMRTPETEIARLNLSDPDIEILVRHAVDTFFHDQVNDWLERLGREVQ